VNWVEGDYNYTVADGVMDPYGYRPRLQPRNTAGYAVNTSLDDLCFNVEAVAARHVRLFFHEATDPEDLWLGVAEVGFKCANQPTPAARGAEARRATRPCLARRAPRRELPRRGPRASAGWRT